MLWSAEFTLIHARASAARGDVYMTVGCLARALANLTQALFALNERYFLRDKGTLQTISTFPLLPEGYVERAERILAYPGQTPAELIATTHELELLWQSVVSLPGTNYTPPFLHK
jgi:hypothetical protein